MKICNMPRRLKSAWTSKLNLPEHDDWWDNCYMIRCLLIFTLSAFQTLFISLSHVFFQLFVFYCFFLLANQMITELSCWESSRPQQWVSGPLSQISPVQSLYSLLRNSAISWFVNNESWKWKKPREIARYMWKRGIWIRSGSDKIHENSEEET